MPKRTITNTLPTGWKDTNPEWRDEREETSEHYTSYRRWSSQKGNFDSEFSQFNKPVKGVPVSRNSAQNMLKTLETTNTGSWILISATRIISDEKPVLENLPVCCFV